MDSDSGADVDADAGLDNFLKSRVRMQRCAEIKKLLKIYIFFYILLCMFFYIW